MKKEINFAARFDWENGDRKQNKIEQRSLMKLKLGKVANIPVKDNLKGK